MDASKIAQETLDNIGDDPRLFEETLNRIKADPQKADKLLHYNILCRSDDEDPEAEEEYWESTFDPTMRQVILEVAKAMVVVTEQKIANPEEA